MTATGRKQSFQINGEIEQLYDLLKFLNVNVLRVPAERLAFTSVTDKPLYEVRLDAPLVGELRSHIVAHRIEDLFAIINSDGAQASMERLADSTPVPVLGLGEVRPQLWLALTAAR